MSSALLQDLRYGSRILGRSPAFTAGAVLSLGLGIGANTAIFTMLDGALFRDLPVRNPQELVQLLSVGPRERSPSGAFSYPVFERLRNSSVTAGMTAAAQMRANVGVEGGPAVARAELVSGNFHSLLGVAAAAGRTLTEDDDRAARPVAVLSHSYWQLRFASDPGVVGRHITVNGRPFAIVGVTSREFYGIDSGYPNDLTLPISTQPLFDRPALDDPGRRWLQIVARLQPGVSRDHAGAALDAAYQQAVAATLPPDQRARPDREQRRLTLEDSAGGLGNIRRVAMGAAAHLVASVAVVLGIACANVAMLVLARSAARAREIGIRLALGAGRLRLVRQLLTESLLLGLLGGAAGLILAAWSLRLLLLWLPPQGRPLIFELRPDARTLGFTALLSASTSVLFGLAPALRATRVDCNQVIRQQGARPAAGGRARASQVLVAGQFALALVLVVAAGLFVRGLRQLDRIDLGFDRAQVLVVTVDGKAGGYKDHELPALYRRLLERVEGLPGVEVASVARYRLMADSPEVQLAIPGYVSAPGEATTAALNLVGPSFFRTMKIPLLAGREFTRSDSENAPGVAVVDETLARRYFGDASPIGRRLRLYASRAPEVEIVGVAANVRPLRLRDPVEPAVFLSYLQVSESLGGPGGAPMMFQARVAGDPVALGPAARQAIRTVDRNLPIAELRTLADQVEERFSEQRLATVLSSAFGTLALVLAGIGLAGTMAYTVAQRTREISVRMALGATRRNVVGLVARKALALVLAGAALGLPAALGIGLLISAQVPGVGRVEAVTIASAIALMVVVALMAAFLPARRASRVQPMEALRYE